MMKPVLFALFLCLIALGFPQTLFAASYGLSPATIAFDTLPDQITSQQITLFRSNDTGEESWKILETGETKKHVSVQDGSTFLFAKGEMEHHLILKIDTHNLPIEKISTFTFDLTKPTPSSARGNTIQYGIQAKISVHVIKEPTDAMKAIDLSSKSIPNSTFIPKLIIAKKDHQPNLSVSITNISTEIYKNVPFNVQIVLPHASSSAMSLVVSHPIKPQESVTIPVDYSFSEPGSYQISTTIGETSVKDTVRILSENLFAKLLKETTHAFHFLFSKVRS